MFPSFPFSQLDSLYSVSNHPRYSHLISRFQKEFGSPPEFIARAPGRVNIIGEHIDYQGYGVLPTAIEKDCLIAVSVTEAEKEVELRHVNPETYPGQTLPRDPEANAEYGDNYVKYFRAGYRAGVKGMPSQRLVGLRAMIEGNVPVASGLSSSSALCVCSALAARHANGGHTGPYVQGTREKFIQDVIEGERETGTASGGMDQSISVLGRAGACLYIRFSPIRCEPVRLPSGISFVVMNSMVGSAKLETAVFRYNKRVCECRIAVNLLAKKLGMPGEPKILREVEEWAGLGLEALEMLVDGFLQRRDYTPEELQDQLGRDLKEALSDIPLHQEVLKANKVFRPWEAAKHVFSEAHRVLQFIRVCHSNIDDSAKRILLGRLMNESQVSCKELYQCSCPELDELTSLALRKGALGSRLTGAGWGGCAIAMVESERSRQFIEEILEEYYRKRGVAGREVEEVVFESRSAEGAAIVIL